MEPIEPDDYQAWESKYDHWDLVVILMIVCILIEVFKQ